MLNKPKLFDIGANLANSRLYKRLDEIQTHNADHGITNMIAIGCDLDESKTCLNLAQTHPNVYATAGVHPHSADTVDDATFVSLETLLSKPEVVAVGETGLDYNRNYSPPANQRHSFEGHIELACHTQKTLYVHQRDAHDDVFSLIRKHRARLDKIVVHCFTDTEQSLRDLIELDCYIGITGWVCDERRGKPLQDMVKYIPQDRILIETDAPFLLPRTLRPKPKKNINLPHYLTEVARITSELRQEDYEEFCKMTHKNAYDCFKIAYDETA